MVLQIVLADILLIAPIFPHPCGARKNTTQLVKYPRVLSVEPSNKVYLQNANICISYCFANVTSENEKLSRTEFRVNFCPKSCGRFNDSVSGYDVGPVQTLCACPGTVLWH